MCRFIALFAFAIASCSAPVNLPSTPNSDIPASLRTIDQSLAAATEFLVRSQSPDGPWRSDIYGTFKNGTALTPFAVVALQSANTAPEARRKGAAYLAAMVTAEVTINEGPDGLDFPVYTASLSVIALSHPENKHHLPARDAWLRYLLDRQLTEKLGWKEGEKEYGGWGYCRALPTKPEAKELAPPLIESNLSATVFALEALRAAGASDGKIYEKAHAFVRSCRNDDGGFHFIYDDPVRNKAGAESGDLRRFHSYGSTTADGARAMALCGHPDPQAVRWLHEHFRVDRHPGHYIPTHESNRDAVYYYYAASAAKSLRQSKAESDRSAKLAAELIRRQQHDGSWSNPVELVRENDPIVATCHAVTAIAECRAANAK